MKSVVGTISHVCLAGNRHFQNYNEMASFFYAIIIYVQILTQMIKSNTTGFLRIQRHNSKMLKRIIAKDN